MDAVYTWVDGDDPAHEAKRRAYSCDAAAPGINKKADLPTRFADEGELQLSVRLLRENAPWVENIYLVTDEQRPHWLDAQNARALGITVVDHRDIFVGFEDCLPTFNSQTIEAMLWRIPGLSENFVYLNDDFFVLRPVEVDDFFSHGKPVFRGQWVTRNWLLKKIRRFFNLGREGLVGKRAEIDLLELGRYFSLAHAPYPLTRAMLQSCFKNEHALREHLSHRYRHANQIWPIGYAANVSFMNGQAEEGPDDWKSIFPAEMTESDLRDLAEALKASASMRLLCIQSLDQAPAVARRFLFDFLEGFTLHASLDSSR